MPSISDPLFSIATPTRNALGKLRRCVGSVRGQEAASYEHLVQDAKSSDGTPQWLAAQSDSDARLLPVSESDGGMYDAINRAWARSRGRYLSWLNSDEQYLPGTLARISAWFDSHSECDAVFGDYLVAAEDGQAIALRREIPLRRFYVANSFLNAQSCTLFFRRRLLDQGMLRLDSCFRYAADMDLVLTLREAGVRFGHLPEALSIFGVDGGNLSTHAGMETETEGIRLAHGGFRWRPLRGVPLALRRAERLLRGAYAPASVTYAFAVDETPRYVRFFAQRLGGRYSLADTSGRAVRLSPEPPGSRPP